ncbi:MAG TPA: hypothetical protein VN277_00080 [Acidiferrobacterales bacterium]|nr:hypothetical protein [Acidiferrobacterales bacterium]
MTAQERLKAIRVKVERAMEHFRELGTEVRTYLDANPYVLGTKRDAESKRLIYYLISVQPTPLRISAILGDTIHNLRGALDHLAYQLVWIGTGALPSNHVYFPIADDATRYLKQRNEQMKGARAQALSAIDTLQPYRGGNDTLWKLHKLNNVDKHRVLITAGSAFQSVNIGAHITRHLHEQIAADSNHKQLAGFPTLDLYIRPADRMFPLKAGDELFIDAPDANVDKNLQFRFELAFSEPGVAMGEPIIETVQPMVQTVDDIVSQFEPLLA